MRSLDDLSGPWRGMSLQDGFRISEAIHLVFERGRLVGGGEDSDGIFELVGGYDEAGNVQMIRRYTVCHFGPETVGMPFEYLGKWDGELIGGHWHAVDNPYLGDEFEMWPESGETMSIRELFRATEPVPA